MKKRQSSAERPQPADLNAAQIRAAIPKLERRLAELASVDFADIRERTDPRFDALQQKYDDTLVEVFRDNTIEYNRYRIASFDTSGISLFDSTPLPVVIDGYKRGIAQAVSNVRTIIELFTEKLDDLAETREGRATRAFSSLDLHPEISRACSRLFMDGHYSNAVEDACKALNTLVKLRSGRNDPDGTELMQLVFSPKNPTLRFNELQTDTQQSEQMGMMFLYSGAMLAIRNPRAHELVSDHPETALEYLGLLSMLANALDRAEKVIRPPKAIPK